MSIIHENRHLFRIAAITGIAPYWPSGNNLRPSRVAELFSLICFLLTFSGSLLEAKRTLAKFSNSKPTGYLLILIGTNSITCILTTLCLLFAYIYRNTMIQNMNNLCLIYENLLQDERLQRRIVNIALILPVLNLLTISLTASTHFFQMNFMVPVSTVIESFLFLTFVQITGFGYRRINQGLQTRTVDLAMIRKIMETDHCLKDFISTINLSFGPHIYLYTTMMVLSMLCLETYVIDGQTDYNTRIQLVLHSFCFSAYFIFVVYHCNIVRIEAEKTCSYLHGIFTECEEPTTRKAIEIVLLQLLHRKVQFNACGFFKFDYPLIYSMIGAVTTYMVVLIQFQGTNNCK